MKIKCASPSTNSFEIKEVSKVIKSGNFVSGKYVKKFEDNFSKFLKIENSCAVSSCTAALHIVFSVLGIKEKDEVIVPPLTFISSITPIMYLGAIPIFADISLKNYCLDPEDVEKKITKRTKAIVAVHFAGNICEMDKLKKIAKKNKIILIEDCAQALGGLFKNKPVGTIGDVGIFSFYSTKHITTGEGGMIVSKNKKFIDKCRLLRSHGLKGRDDHIYLGFNYRMTEIGAAMGIHQLKKLNKLLQRRLKFSKFLLNKIGKLKKKSIIVPKILPNIKHVFFWCVLLVNLKFSSINKIKTYLNSKGIELRYRYKEPLYKQKIFKNLKKEKPYIWQDYNKLNLTNSEKICGNIFGIPNHPNLKNKEIEYIIKTFKEID